MLADLNPPPAAVLKNKIKPVLTLHWSGTAGTTARTEDLVVEAPLCIEVSYTRNARPIIKTLGITMRTPGLDQELVLGFLLGEGVITRASEVRRVDALQQNRSGETIDTCRVVLAAPPRHDLQRVSRAVTTTSACGLCGRATLEGLPLPSVPTAVADHPALSGALIAQLPERLRAAQSDFAVTGGSHGAGLSNCQGDLLLCREDVGRHNAVDKLLGAALIQGLVLSEGILVLSGRASFELVQKSAAAGLPIIVAVGAPSSAAVELAHAAGITLIGFTRDNRFNLYTHAPRIRLE